MPTTRCARTSTTLAQYAMYHTEEATAGTLTEEYHGMWDAEISTAAETEECEAHGTFLQE